MYSNTTGNTIIEIIPANGLAADDLTMAAEPGCPLHRYRFRVIGKANPAGVGGAYRTDFALYNNCPGAGPPNAAVIPGTTGFVEFDPGEETVVQEIEYVVPDGVSVTLPATIWLGIRFNRSNCGVVFGAPAELGVSDDLIDWPGFACNANAGGYPQSPHASFHAQLFGDPSCGHTLPGYRNIRRAGAAHNEGHLVCFADDFELQTQECRMVAFEAGLRLSNGNAGSGTFIIRENADGAPGDVIAGATFPISVTGTPNTSIVRRTTVDPPITLPQKIWMTFEGSTALQWTIATSSAEVGDTAPAYARSMPPSRCSTASEWDVNALPIAGFHGFDFTIVCESAPNNECAFAEDLGGTADPNTAISGQSILDPAFCCNRPDSNATTYGTLWYQFVATHSSARLDTCATESASVDSLIQVFAVDDSSSPTSACTSLALIGCNDDSNACGMGSDDSSLCLGGLVPGQTYYVLIAAKTNETRGVHTLTLSSPCGSIDRTCPPRSSGPGAVP